MPDEIKKEEVQEKVQETVPENNQYIETIKELKNSTVSKDEFEKVKAENKQLLDSLVKGQPQQDVKPQPTAKEIDAHINQLRDMVLNDSELNNLEYVQAALDLRNAIIDRDGPESDPFVGHGHKLTPTEEDYEAGQRVADVFQECIDKSEGQSDIFTAQLQNHTLDVKLPKATKPKKQYQY